MIVDISRKLFNPHFLPLLDDEHFVLLLLGGAASGKSYFSFQRAIYRCLLDKRKYIILRKHAVDVRRSCFEDVKTILTQWNLLSLVSINTTLMTIKFLNGSEMIFTGCDDVEKLKSIPNLTDAIFEEASEFSPVDFDQLKIRLRGKGRLSNQIILQSNPVSKANWLYLRFFENGCLEDNCLIDRSTYKDNPFCNEATKSSLEAYKKTNPAYYTVYCLGEFGSLSKLVYSNWHTEDLDIPHLYKQGFTLCVGLDWGYSADPSAIAVMLADEGNKKLYIVDEFYKTGMLNEDIANQLKVMGLNKSTIIADSAEPKSIDELKKKGITRIKPSIKGQGSINTGISKLQEYEIIVDSHCENFTTELQNYSYKRDKATGEYINEPEDRFNHLLDAARYGIQCIDSRSKLSSLPRYSL